jgi:hypothetical protein
MAPEHHCQRKQTGVFRSFSRSDRQVGALRHVSLVNRSEFDYLVENELYNLEGQAAFVRNSKIEFPANVGASAGAIEIKLAWKVLTGAEGGSNRFLIKCLPVDANFSWLLQLEAKAKNPK